MIKYLCLFAFILIATVQATNTCRPVCRRNVQSKAVCATDNNQRICHRMTQCRMEEENCRRRNENMPLLSGVKGSRCRNIKAPNKQGPCAKVRPPRASRPDCSRLKCSNPSNTLSCYRCSHNLCQLLTPCQLQRVNCERGESNRLNLADMRHCAGMRRGERLRKCKAIPKRG
ncbi:uncharacterized protein LOC142230290 [Haematobia irritans]|uniref:uncharacterized protein LOC142230290 n=1 Tax=Haematobia irritans TaxID=7368 RepID=UPI003F509793